MNYFIDSSAWIEYLNGNFNGEKVNEIIKDEDNEVFVIPEIISEVIRYVARKGNKETAYESIIKNSKMFNLTPRIAKDAGLLFAEKKRFHNFPLIDSLIICSAESINAKIVTKDMHFSSFKNIVLLR